MKPTFLILYIFFVINFFIPSTAFAYLDPGTGNALVYVALSLLGTVLYFFKGLFYKLINRKEVSHDADNSDFESIVIFCEGRSYWKIFRPIVEQLIKHGQSFYYFTMDRQDPCLLLDNPYMDNKYIGTGNKAYVKMGNLNANVVLVTTPNIGTPGYPIPRSRRIRKLVYMPHAFGDIAFLHRGSLDYYDSYMLTGNFQTSGIRKIEKIRNLPAKELYPAGSPHIEELISRVETGSYAPVEKDYSAKENITILLAPSWGEKGFLKYYGTDFIIKLAQAGFRLILRPHPQSLIVEKKLLKEIEKTLKPYANISLDYRPDATQSFEVADILVSDVSEIRFEFAMAYQKPFITIPLNMTEETIQEYELADLGTSWTEDAMQRIGYGYTVKDSEIDKLDLLVMNVLQKTDKAKIIEFRNANIYNLGHAGKAIAEYLITANASIENETKRETV